MLVTRENLTEVLQLPKGERLRLFRKQLESAINHMPHNYAAITLFKFPHLSTKEGRTHIYNVKAGTEDWELLLFWEEAFRQERVAA